MAFEWSSSSFVFSQETFHVVVQVLDGDSFANSFVVKCNGASYSTF